VLSRFVGNRDLLLRCILTDAEAKRSDRMRDVLGQLLAQIVESHAGTMTQVIVQAPRDADLAALDQPLEPSSDVHAVAEDVVVLDHDVADIDADPEAHPASLRLASVGPLKRRLDLDRAVNCVEHAGEFGEHAVARGIRDPASMLGNELVGKDTTGGQRRHRRFFVAMHQAAVAPRHPRRGSPLDVSRSEEPPSEKPSILP
jgi:hypothetical protein